MILQLSSGFELCMRTWPPVFGGSVFVNLPWARAAAPGQRALLRQRHIAAFPWRSVPLPSASASLQLLAPGGCSSEP